MEYQENLAKVNLKEKRITNSMVSSMEEKYKKLKEKLSELETNNIKIQNLYNNEKERLTKENNRKFTKVDEGREKYIKELENFKLNLKKDCEKIKLLIEEKEKYFKNLTKNNNDENKNINCFNKNDIDNIIQNDIQEQNLKELVEGMKSDFENKVSLKVKELKEYYDKKEI